MPLDTPDREEILSLTERIIELRESFQEEIDAAQQEYDDGELSPRRVREAVRRLNAVDDFIAEQPEEDTREKLRAIIEKMETELVGQDI